MTLTTVWKWVNSFLVISEFLSIWRILAKTFITIIIIQNGSEHFLRKTFESKKIKKDSNNFRDIFWIYWESFSHRPSSLIKITVICILKKTCFLKRANYALDTGTRKWGTSQFRFTWKKTTKRELGCFSYRHSYNLFYKQNKFHENMCSFYCKEVSLWVHRFYCTL